MKILAVGHRSRQGKDAVAKFLQTELKCTNRYKDIRRIPIAYSLKVTTATLYGWAGMRQPEHYENHPEDRYKPLPYINKTPVEIWIDFGTLVGRNVYEHTWIDYLLNSTSCDLLLIPDLRFPDEATAIKQKGGFCIKVE